jgi:DNA repair exonuclease SbcCD ATPase subunit
MIAVPEQVKVASFMSKRNSLEDRIKEDEAELAQLEKPVEVKSDEAPAANREEETFKKRYGDLRRHSQKVEQELRDKLKQMENQLQQLSQKEIKLPKSEEEVEEWCQAYPDVAKIVETIAIKKAREQTEALNQRVKKVDELESKAIAERAEAELLRIHPDFDQIREDDDFHDWAEEQPKWMQDALFNGVDAKAAARVIDLYKSDRGITKKSSPSTKDAAKNVNTRGGRSVPQTSDPDVIRESDVKRMSDREYEANEEKIMIAMRTGKFVYDLTGNAR